jgi:pimeloyl-ACP methyl ester carboxylesterase
MGAETRAAMSSFDFQGHEVFYESAGSGPPLIFLHNGGSSHRIWTGQIEYFQQTHQVFALDMLGFGRSAKPRIDYTLDLYVEMLTRFIDQQRLHDVALIGNCMGSATALTYAAAHGERVCCVVAFNPLTQATITSGLSGPLVRLALRSARASRLIGRLPVPPVVARAIVAGQLGSGGQPDEQVLEHLRRCYRDPAQLRVLMNIAANMDSFATLDGAREPGAGVPVLVVWGEENRILPAAAGRRLCRTLRPTAETTLPGGHLAMLEHSQAANTVIESHLPVTARR